MKGKKRNKFLAGFLAFVMVFLMLPVVPFAPVEAASAFADNADVIRLPITIRDANADGIVFQISPASWKGWVTNTLSEDGVPEYTNDAIARIADKIDTLNEINTLRSSNSFDETGLGDALYIAYSGNTAGWDSSSFSAADAVDYLNEAKTAHQAAEWLLSHFFVDGKYDRNATATKEYDPEVYFTQTYKATYCIAFCSILIDRSWPACNTLHISQSSLLIQANRHHCMKGLQNTGQIFLSLQYSQFYSLGKSITDQHSSTGLRYIVLLRIKNTAAPHSLLLLPGQ